MRIDPPDPDTRDLLLDEVTLARLDLQTRGVAVPFPDGVAASYLRTVRRTWGVDAHTLDTARAEYLGRTTDPAVLARTITAQSLPAGMDVTAWPFTAMDWATAGAQLVAGIRDETPGPLVRVGGCYWFAPSGR